MQNKSLGQGMVAAGLLKQSVLQFFCFKMLVRKCRDFLCFVFCSYIRVREEDVSLQMEAGSSFCLGW